MITYLYWFAIFALAGGILYGVGVRLQQWKIAAPLVLAVLLVSWGVYYFRFQQVFVKRYGGVMTISVPAGQRHISATWKDDNLWIENYDPATNTCYFTEYSKGNILQGKVTIKKCNPMLQGQ
jgi:hypothetical protein